MTSKHRAKEKCSLLLAIREMQSESIMRHHYVSIRLKWKRLIIISDGKDMEKLEPSFTVGGNVRRYDELGKNLTVYFKSETYAYPYSPAILLLGI